MSRVGRISVATTVIVLAVSGQAQAQEVQLGGDAAKWVRLEGVDGKQHSLDDFRQAKVVVLAFITNHCPIAKAHEDRLIALQRDYGPKGVQLVAVNVNNLPADKLDKMKERAAEKKFNFPYLYDPSQKIGKDYGATVTPHVFVLDQNRKLVYRGAIDDSVKPDEVKTHHLRDVLDAVLGRKTPAVRETTPRGCDIQYDKQ